MLGLKLNHVSKRGHWGLHSKKASDTELRCFFICTGTNGWANNRDAGDLRRHPLIITSLSCISGTCKFYPMPYMFKNKLMNRNIHQSHFTLPKTNISCREIKSFDDLLIIVIRWFTPGRYAAFNSSEHFTAEINCITRRIAHKLA